MQTSTPLVRAELLPYPCPPGNLKLMVHHVAASTRPIHAIWTSALGVAEPGPFHPGTLQRFFWRRIHDFNFVRILDEGKRDCLIHVLSRDRCHLLAELGDVLDID